GAQLLDIAPDARRRELRRFMAMSRIVGAEHEHDHLGRGAIHFAVLQAPEHVFSAVAAKAQRDGIVSGIVARPDVLAVLLPAFGDGVADENDLAALAFR